MLICQFVCFVNRVRDYANINNDVKREVIYERFANIPLREGQPVLACQGNSFRGRGKSTSCSRVRSFVRTPLEDNLGVSGRGWRVAVDITWGLRGAVACPVSRPGIARDISSPLALPLAEKSAQLPQMTIAATSRSLRRFNTKSTPPAVPVYPRRSLASVSSSHVMPRS